MTSFGSEPISAEQSETPQPSNSDSSVGPPPLPPTSPTTERPQQESSDSNPASGWRWVALTVALVAVAVVGTLLFLYSQALGDKSDVEDALALSQTKLAEAEADLAQADEALALSQTKLAEDEADLAQADEALALSQTKLAEDEADLAQADEAMVGFLTLTIGEAFADIDEETVGCITNSLYATHGVQIVLALLDSTQTSALDVTLGLDLIRASEECGAPIDEMFSAPGFAYGDNPGLDVLYDECAAGSGGACDALYSRSEFGSDYENFGATCGERLDLDPTRMFCAGNI